VDLPGYGFAKVSRAEQEKWGPMIETYLRERVNLRLVVSILDVRHDPTQQDRDLIEWLRHYGPILIVRQSRKLPGKPSGAVSDRSPLTRRRTRPIIFS
jgi:GTP-binding protein